MIIIFSVYLVRIIYQFIVLTSDNEQFKHSFDKSKKINGFYTHGVDGWVSISAFQIFSLRMF